MSGRLDPHTEGTGYQGWHVYIEDCEYERMLDGEEVEGKVKTQENKPPGREILDAVLFYQLFLIKGC